MPRCGWETSTRDESRFQSASRRRRSHSITRLTGLHGLNSWAGGSAGDCARLELALLIRRMTCRRLVIASIGTVGDSFDNALAGAVIGLHKTEHVNVTAYCALPTNWNWQPCRGCTGSKAEDCTRNRISHAVEAEQKSP